MTIKDLNPTPGTLVAFGEIPETATVYRFLGFGPNEEEGASAASSHPDVKLRIQSYWTGHVWNKKDSADTERFLTLECTEVEPTKVPARILAKPRLQLDDLVETLKLRLTDYEFAEVKELDSGARNKAHIVSRIKDDVNGIRKAFSFLDSLDMKKAEDEVQNELQEGAIEAVDIVDEIASSEDPEMPM